MWRYMLKNFKTPSFSSETTPIWGILYVFEHITSELEYLQKIGWGTVALCLQNTVNFLSVLFFVNWHKFFCSVLFIIFIDLGFKPLLLLCQIKPKYFKIKKTLWERVLMNLHYNYHFNCAAISEWNENRRKLRINFWRMFFTLA